MTRLNALKEETRTMIFYESPYRLVKTLTQFIEFSVPNVRYPCVVKSPRYTRKVYAERCRKWWIILPRQSRGERLLSY